MRFENKKKKRKKHCRTTKSRHEGHWLPQQALMAANTKEGRKKRSKERRVGVGDKSADYLQIKKFWVESDSIIDFNLLNLTDVDLHSGYHHCKLSSSYAVFDHHVHCERNVIVDVLTKDNITLLCGTAIFCSPPAHVAHLVYENIDGTGRSIIIGLNRPCS